AVGLKGQAANGVAVVVQLGGGQDTDGGIEVRGATDARYHLGAAVRDRVLDRVGIRIGIERPLTGRNVDGGREHALRAGAGAADPDVVFGDPGRAVGVRLVGNRVVGRRIEAEHQVRRFGADRLGSGVGALGHYEVHDLYRPLKIGDAFRHFVHAIAAGGEHVRDAVICGFVARNR